MKNDEIELERTFLAKKIPEEINNVQPEEMIDIYVPSSAQHPQLRIRKRGEKYVITKKKPLNDDASVQVEISIPLTQEEYAELSTVPGKRLAKLRYKVEIAGRMAEVDVFQEELKGLVVIDFEFDNVEDKDRFIMPDCCLCDVTHEQFIAGGLIAGKKYSDIEPELKRLNYKAI